VRVSRGQPTASSSRRIAWDSGGWAMCRRAAARPNRSLNEAVGCVAPMPDGNGAYELSKMAIAPALRGRGAGRALLSAAIDHARELGARSLFLGSSRKLANAVHLYEALGFEHVAPETLDMPYARADVFMQLGLAPSESRLSRSR
jgi:putative acetyltransferase